MSNTECRLDQCIIGEFFYKTEGAEERVNDSLYGILGFVTRGTIWNTKCMVLDMFTLKIESLSTQRWVALQLNVTQEQRLRLIPFYTFVN